MKCLYGGSGNVSICKYKYVYVGARIQWHRRHGQARRGEWKISNLAVASEWSGEYIYRDNRQHQSLHCCYPLLTIHHVRVKARDVSEPS